MADIGPTDMAAVSALQMLALHRRQEAGNAQEAADGISHENLAGLLERDLQGPRRVETLRGLLDLLCDDGADTRAAVAKVLDSVSWELFEATMGCLDESMPSSSSSTPGGAASSLLLHGEDGDRDGSNTEKRTGNVDCSSSGSTGIPAELMEAAEVAVLSERLVLEMAEIFSPKELHVMALAHLPAYSGDRAVRAVLTALRRSTQRMPPLQRAKFLEAAIPPVIKATKRLAASAVSTDPVSSSDDDDDEEQDSSSSGEGNHAHGLDVQQPPLPGEDDNPPRAVYEAAASAAETAVAFVGPLLEQACAEGALARDGAALEASAAAQDPDKQSGKGERSAYPGAGNAAASDLAVAAYTGFALSALEISAETSASVAATATAPAAIAAVSPAQAALESDSSAFAMKLAKAEERLVGLVMSSPAVDLPLVLLHGYRLSFDDRVKARGKGGGGATGSERPASCGSRGGLAGLAELAITGSSPWTLQGVSSFAYSVACQPGLRDKWLPLVWSRRTERRLFLPHAEVLMRSSSKRVARKGLELACFVGERLGTFPDETGAFAFEWEQDGGEVDGEVDGAWVGRSDEDLLGEEDEETHRGASASKGRHRQRGTFDPYYVDLTGFLQVLVDVMVSCPLPGLRARGHAAMLAFLAATDEGSRFRALKRLIERCPWPNAAGLLLDAFRREIDRALRCEPAERVFLTAEEAFLTAERASLTAERASVASERASLTSERASLTSERESLAAKQASLTANQASLTAKQASLTAKQASLAAKQASLTALGESLAAKQASLTANQASLAAASQDCGTSGTSSGGCSPSSTGNSSDSEETGGWERVGSGSSRTSDDTAEMSTAGAAEVSEAASLTALRASRTAARSSLAAKQASLAAAAQDCGTGGTSSGGCLPSSTGNSSDSGEAGGRERAGSGSSCTADDAAEMSAAEAAEVSEAASLTALQASRTAARSSLAAKQASLALAVARASLTAASQDCGAGGTSSGGCLRSSTGNSRGSGEAGGRGRVGLGSSCTADDAAEMSAAEAAEVSEAASLTALQASRTAARSSLAAKQASLALAVARASLTAASQDCGTGGTRSGGCLRSSTGNSSDSGEAGGRERVGLGSSCTTDDAAEMSAAGAAEVAEAASLTALRASRTANQASLAAKQASLAAATQDCGTGGTSSGGCLPSSTGNSSDSGETGGRERAGSGSSCTADDAAETSTAGAAEVSEAASLTALQASRTAARSSLAAAQASLALAVARASLTAASQDRGTGGTNSGACLRSSTGNSSDSGKAGGRERVRPGSSCTPGDAAKMPAAGAAEVAETAAGPSPPRSCGGLEASPFSSPLAGDFVCEQLRRACRKGPPASMLMDMDSRTGGLTLARYAHALDGVGGGGGNVGNMGARRERLMLREPQKLRDNQLLVEGFLSELRGAAVTADSAGPDHFRLFILEDAAQQCLEELQRQSANPL